MNGHCNNPHCSNENIPGTQFCSQNCELKYLNSIRLAFWPELRPEEDNPVVELNSRASIISLQSWDKLTTDQKMFKINLLMDACTQLMTMVYAEKNRDEVIAKADAEALLKSKMRKSVHERQELSQSIVELDRVKAGLKKSGEKLSKEGKCGICEKPSVAKYCTVRCKSIAQFVNVGMTIAKATEAVDLMQSGLGASAK